MAILSTRPSRNSVRGTLYRQFYYVRALSDFVRITSIRNVYETLIKIVFFKYMGVRYVYVHFI